MFTQLERNHSSETIFSQEYAKQGLVALNTEPRIVILKNALGNDAELYFVGGTVRDLFWGMPPVDIDLASRFTPEDLIIKCEQAGIRIIPTGKRHQTVTVVPIPNLGAVEITTFRSAGMTPKSGVVVGRSIEEDLRYRDFTINALAYSLAENEFVDEVQGIADLQVQLLRAVGEPKLRFAEDPLRILRMVRIACEHNLTIEVETAGAALAAASSLSGVSVERIRDELLRILVSKHPGRGLRLLAELKLLEQILPEIAIFVGYEQNRFHHLDLFEHTIAVVENCDADEILRFAALLHDVGKPATLTVDEQTGDRHFFKHESVGSEMAREIMVRLRFSHLVIDAVVALIETHMRPLEAGPGGLRRLLRDVGDEYPRWRKLKEADARGCVFNEAEFTVRIERFDETMAEVQRGPAVSPLRSLAVNGHDIMAAGISAGPRVGVILRALHERVLDNPEINTKEQLLALLSSINDETPIS